MQRCSWRHGAEQADEGPAGCGADDGECWSEVVEVDVWLLLLLVLEAAVRALVT